MGFFFISSNASSIIGFGKVIYLIYSIVSNLLVEPYGIESLDSFGLIQPDGIICCMNISKLTIIVVVVLLLVGLVIDRLL